MKVDYSSLINSGLVVGIALSGGGDSMALLHFLNNVSKNNGFSIVAINVEHGIRGKNSLRDTDFVKNYCEQNGIKLFCYSVDSIKKSKESKLSIEQAARFLRYQCFAEAIESGKCNKIATAHHSDDNAETILFNLFRGTGLKGLSGINSERKDNVLRPLLKTSKQEIEEYLNTNRIPFVTDETNQCDEYTRNFLRLNVIPTIKKAFPEAQRSINRFAEIAEIENAYMEEQAEKSLLEIDNGIKIALPLHHAVFNRATIMALQKLGVEKDWEKVHVDDAFALSLGKNGNKINLPKNIIAIKEQDGVVFYKEKPCLQTEVPFSLGVTQFNGQSLIVKKCDGKPDLASGFYADLNKIPKNAVIRTKRTGDTFTKFGGGTKSLGDFFTDKKIPQRIRNNIPLIACGKNVLAIFGVAISDNIKVDEFTTQTVEFLFK